MARTAVVTGASSGIGAATVRRLRSDGWDVIGVARREDRLRSLAEQTGAMTVTADLTDPAGVDRLRDAVAAHGPVHALVNNAGGAIGKESVEDGDADEWRTMFETNVLATKQVTAALLPLLRRSVTGSDAASIVNVTSTAGMGVYEGGAGYNAAKFAQSALTQVLRLELNGEPIRVIEIAPGMVRTEEFALVRFRGDEEKAARVYDDVPAPLVADDIADVIAYTLGVPPHVNIDRVVIRPVAQAANHKIAKGRLQPRR